MARFGDLSSITHNKRSGHLVSGHQRLKHLQPNAKIVITERTPEDDVGTVSVGYIKSGANRWPYRIVDWDVDTEKAAMIAANAAGGAFDYVKLGKLVAELDGSGFDLDLCGLESVEDILADANAPAGAADETPSTPTKTNIKRGEVYLLGAHRLMCGDSTNAKDVEKLMGRERAHLVFTDPPYGVSYDAKSGDFAVIEGDRKRDDDLYNLVAGALKQAVAVAENNAAFYVWHASSTRREFEDALRDAGLTERQYLLWVKNAIVLGRADYHWSHEPCQPAGTMVERVFKAAPGRGRPSITEKVPIEALVAGDRVVTYDSPQCKVRRRGEVIERVGRRDYSGNMHTIRLEKKSTRATADHRFTVRINPGASDKHIVYLMRRGDWWRVGTVQLYNSRGFALAVRANDEKADGAWIVDVCDNHLSARVSEQAISCLYGIPTTHWETGKSNNNPRSRSKMLIAKIYEQIGLQFIGDGANRLLASRGLSVFDPIVKRGENNSTSRKDSRLIRARNIVQGLMQIPVPTEGEGFEWQTVTSAAFEYFNGPVYSMDVRRHKHYVADGIITHNCFYAAKTGHKPAWHGDRAQPTVWRVTLKKRAGLATTLGSAVVLLDGAGGQIALTPALPKAKKNRSMRLERDVPLHIETASDSADVFEVAREHGEYVHPTQKPVELAAIALKNSSKPGQIVLDLFGGSGTTLMAAEALGRTARLMEMDPRYVQAIVNRWQEATNCTAEREE